MKNKLTKKELWQIFERRETLTNHEIVILLTDARQALKFFKNRNNYVDTINKLTYEIACLKHYSENRGESNLNLVRDSNGEIKELAPIKILKQ